MKISKTFRLSEEAVEILNRQDSPTQFIEDLILGQASQSLNIQYVTKEEVIALIEERVGGMQTKEPKIADKVSMPDLEKQFYGQGVIEELKKIPGVTTADELEEIKYEPIN